MWMTGKTHEDLTFKPRSSQNGKFQKETGEREVTSQNGRDGIYAAVYQQ